MLIDSSEQVLPLFSDLHVDLVYSPLSDPIILIPTNPLLEFRRIAMNLPHDCGWLHFNATLLNHLCQIAIRCPILAVPANKNQNDLNRKTATLEHDPS
jgi:hypothetical protein